MTKNPTANSISELKEPPPRQMMVESAQPWYAAAKRKDATHQDIYMGLVNALNHTEGALIAILNHDDFGRRLEEDLRVRLVQLRARNTLAMPVAFPPAIVAAPIAQPQPGWQPIETAPTDAPFIGGWYMNTPHEEIRRVEPRQKDWPRSRVEYYAGKQRVFPTHWLPRPVLPTL